jgi:hypothetical protein
MVTPWTRGIDEKAVEIPRCVLAGSGGLSQHPLVQGGDASIVAGWLYLLWTALFGVVWCFWLYDIVLAWLPASVAQPLGAIVVDSIAFAFWLLVVPRVRRLHT